jgi:uncharacterized membrane protein (UPF0127 family)
MKNKQKFTSFFIVVIFLVVGFFLINQPSKNFSQENIKSVKIAGQNIKVDLALTRETQAQGLSGLSNLAENHGMLFVFEKPGSYYFWMKGMNFPIDIIWLTEDMKVVYIKKNAQPEAFLETFGPDINTKYVLEVVSGFSDKNNLKVGDMAEFTY